MFRLFSLFDKKPIANKVVIDMENKIFELVMQVKNLQDEVNTLNDNASISHRHKVEAQCESRKYGERAEYLEILNNHLNLRLQQIAKIAVLPIDILNQ